MHVTDMVYNRCVLDVDKRDIQWASVLKQRPAQKASVTIVDPLNIH